MSRSQAFWDIETQEEREVVRKLLKRRFPAAYASLTTSLEQADPFEIVYPHNPHEYDDVVREIIVLLAPLNGRLSGLTVDDLVSLMNEALARCFGEDPPPERVRRAAELALSKITSSDGRLP